jgi:hypothetical protein
MNEVDRNTENVLLKLREMGNCDETATCSCTIHQMLLRLLAQYKQEREREIRAGFERQASIEEQKITQGDD